ncbi:DUF1120 domain-containing protein [Klebsiella oxytoca]|uniref:DUF1120 domain-containing protein n=1 Tax=Klebsiella oxytoca TaxID=571 RepID=UPI000D52813B|nr:DUF1120 domain-containing protein [Klebsiella oxytoca]AWF34458.1 fimbrial family protein [Klebsiella oxytoca]EIY2867486.1 DUF1120 domain-containing protein [Klebsiella oxytoca]EKQ7192065.1 DUF1120 domain-containing protein [Klebsiella oxytoca]QTV83999.1 DUF1120 domain-containing protein [Klebsiella oxytoca]WBD83634.1 DUF1120 domain-containing protein [Klebsiella oxytoca]
MKKLFVMSVLACSVSTAMAAETAVMKVQGTLTNAACTPSLSNGGVVDYGYIHLSELSATEINPLEEKTIDLTISCTSPTKVAWDGLDNQSSSRPSPLLSVKNYDGNMTSSVTDFSYGMGETDAGVKIGNYALYVDTSPVADGKSGTLIGRNTDWSADASWTDGVNGQRSDQMSWLTVATTGSLEPVAFTTATFQLKVHATLQDTTTLAIKDDTKINGQATFTLHYL